jgi:glycosyltransferase involved in cell wall biosynthesis
MPRVERGTTTRPEPRGSVIGFAGALSWPQGVDLLPPAVELVRRTHPRASLLVVGDGLLRADLQARCAAGKVPLRLTGFVPHHVALWYLRGVDLLVAPGRHWATRELVLPLKVLEAWALGIPVVVTRHRVFVERGFRPDKDVVFCEPTPESIATAIRKLLDDEALRRRLAQRGPQLAQAFSYDRICEELLAVIHNRTGRGHRLAQLQPADGR